MPSFKDANGREWLVALDGITLKELRDAQKLDLSDVAGSVYTQLSRDPALLTTALAFICSDQIKAAQLTPKQFSAGIVGKVLDDAFAALWVAAELFFPPSLWSALSLRFKQEAQVMDQWAKIKASVMLFNQPGMPPELKEFVFAEIGKMLPGSDLQSLTSEPSVSGPASIPSNPVMN